MPRDLSPFASRRASGTSRGARHALAARSRSIRAAALSSFQATPTLAGGDSSSASGPSSGTSAEDVGWGARRQKVHRGGGAALPAPQPAHAPSLSLAALSSSPPPSSAAWCHAERAAGARGGRRRRRPPRAAAARRSIAARAPAPRPPRRLKRRNTAAQKAVRPPEALAAANNGRTLPRGARRH